MSDSRTITASDLRQMLQAGNRPLILDVRRRADYDADGTIIPGSRWHDPDQMDRLSERLAVDREVIVYCAHGRTLSNAAVDHLLARGHKARLIENGMDGWHAAAGDTLPAPR
jgi:rhodanese-related sulfurtransferase